MNECPICKGPRKSAKDNPTFPFCSGRCKLADLANWMDGAYRLPDEAVSQDEDDGSGGPPTVH